VTTTADPIAGIIYPVRSVAPDVTATMKPTIDAIGVLVGRLRAPAALPGRGGTIAAGSLMVVQCGSTVGVINGAGYLDVTFPVPFSILGAVVTVAGDGYGTGQRAVSVSSPTAAGFSCRVTSGSGDWEAVGVAVRVDWIATGSV
jgi:hypothetical protein